jgi:hypothetical protein
VGTALAAGARGVSFITGALRFALVPRLVHSSLQGARSDKRVRGFARLAAMFRALDRFGLHGDSRTLQDPDSGVF